MTLQLTSGKFSYSKLKNSDQFEEIDGGSDLGRSRSWLRFGRVQGRRRARVKIPGLRRFLRGKARLLSRIRVSWGRVYKRLKEGRCHIGDLFAGNYMFMQVSPTPLGCLEKSFMGNHVHGYKNGMPPRYSLGRIA